MDQQLRATSKHDELRPRCKYVCRQENDVAQNGWWQLATRPGVYSQGVFTDCCAMESCKVHTTRLTTSMVSGTMQISDADCFVI